MAKKKKKAEEPAKPKSEYEQMQEALYKVPEHLEVRLMTLCVGHLVLILL